MDEELHLPFCFSLIEAYNDILYHIHVSLRDIIKVWATARFKRSCSSRSVSGAWCFEYTAPRPKPDRVSQPLVAKFFACFASKRN